MENSKIEIARQYAQRLEEAIYEAFESFESSKVDGPVPNSLRRYLFSLQAHIKLLRQGIVQEDRILVDQELLAIRMRATQLQTALMKGNHKKSAVAAFFGVLKVANSENGSIASPNSELGGDAAIKWQSIAAKQESILRSLQQELSQLETKQAQIRKRAQEVEKLAQVGSDAAHALGEEVAKAKEEANTSVSEILDELRLKQSEVNNLVGLISGTAVAGSYASSGATEKRWADATRNGSVFLMLAAVLLIGYSLLETTTAHFEWQLGIFRLVFSLALSVPAVYLARESTKHRAQQYAYNRMSLDLQSITPYIASLPESEQHRLKAEMANRLFAGKDVDVQTAESYPLNIQELIVALASKIGESAKEPKQAKRSNSEGET